MKNYILIILLIFSASASAQEIKILQDALFVEYGKSTSNFDFTNSLGVSSVNINPTSKNYLRVGYSHDWYFSNKSALNENRFGLVFSLDYNNYGAKGSNKILNNFYEWDLDYLGLNLFLNYDLIKIKDFSFFVTAGSSLDYNLRGTQIINYQVFSLKNSEEFDPFTFFFKGGAGISYPLSENAKIYVQYLYGLSQIMRDDSQNSLEELNISNHSIGLGLLINIKKFYRNIQTQ